MTANPKLSTWAGILLLISLSVHFNLAAVILETAWGLIALSGIISALRAPREGKPS